VLASLWWTKVFARSGCTGPRATGLLDAQGAAFNDLTLESLFCGVSLLGSDHLDEAKATRLLGVRIKHDLALLNIAILLKETSHLRLSETGVDASNKQVGAWVDSTVILGSTAVLLGCTGRNELIVFQGSEISLPVTITTFSRGSRTTRSSTTRAFPAGVWARRGATVTLITWSLVYAFEDKSVFAL
jgi:hypothetical protein